MTQRRTLRAFPDAPSEWDATSREVWHRLIQTLESSDLFDKGRRTRPQFIVKGTVSAPTTLDLSTPEVTVLANIIGKLLVAFADTNFVDVREDI